MKGGRGEGERRKEGKGGGRKERRKEDRFYCSHLSLLGPWLIHLWVPLMYIWIASRELGRVSWKEVRALGNVC